MIAQAWYALHVRTRGEAKVAKALEDRSVPVFLPTYPDPSPGSNRIKIVRAPLFPGYLFATFDPIRRLPILQMPGVHDIVSSNGEPIPVPKSEIDAIRRIVDSGVEAMPWPYLKQGGRITIGYGALAGVKGRILREPAGDRLVVSIDLLQRSISVQLDRSWVRPTNVGQVALDPPNLERIVRRAREVLGDEATAIRWLGEPARALNYATPISIQLDAGGEARVEDLLGQIEHGVW